MKVGTVVYKANILTPEVTERLNKAATLVTGYSCIRIVFPLNFILCGLHGLCGEMFLPEASRSVLRDTASRVFFPRNVRTFCASDIGKQISSCVLDVPTCENL